MALTETKCACSDTAWCGGYITVTERKMAELDPSRTEREYHEINELFMKAYDRAHPI